MGDSLSVYYVLLNFSENVLGYYVKTVLTACKTLCTAEVWKYPGLLCEDSAYCLYKTYAQLRSGNVLGYYVKAVLTACTKPMHS
jgi:hypothetical protein